MRIQTGSSLLLCIAIAALTSASAGASTYSAVNDFSLANNPNGNWSYSAGGALLPDPVVGSGALAGVDYRWSGNSEPDSDVVEKNVTNATVSFATIVLPVGYLDLDPESQSHVDVSLTVPATGTYDITGSFLGIDTNEQSHPVDILLNGAQIFSGTIASYGQNDLFNLTHALTAGETLDFQNDTGATWTYLSTGLSATITSVTATPEPATFGLAFLGFLAVLIRLRKTRRKNQEVPQLI